MIMNKKIVVEYNNGSGWKTVRDHGCVFWIAMSEQAALNYAQFELADKIQKENKCSGDEAYHIVIKYKWKTKLWKE